MQIIIHLRVFLGFYRRNCGTPTVFFAGSIFLWTKPAIGDKIYLIIAWKASEVCVESVSFAVNAILPIVLLIFFGYFLRRVGFLNDEWFKKGNKLVFHVLLPCLLFVNVYNIESFSSFDWSVVIYSEIAVFVIFFLGLIAVKLLVPNDFQKGAVWQCVFRSNYAIIGMPLAAALGGDAGLSVAAVLSASSIPTFNILAVIALTAFNKDENGKKANMLDVLKKIAKNPLIIGVASGMVAIAIRALIPEGSDGLPVFSLRGDLPFIFTAVENIAKISSPLALIVLGGQFDFAVIKHLKRQIITGTLIRIVFVPLLCVGGAVVLSKYTRIINLDLSVYPALLALFGSPVAVSSAVMAQEMDNDGVLAGQLVVWTSIFSIFTLFLFIVVLRRIGVL